MEIKNAGPCVMTLNAMLSFGEYLYEEERSKNTIQKYLRDVRKFYEYLGADKTITRKSAMEFKQYLRDHYEISSCNSMLAALNQFFQYMGLDSYKVKRFRIQSRSFLSEERELTRREYEQLVITAEQQRNTRLSLSMQTIASTGIRVSELSYFTVEGVQRGRIIVENKGKIREILIPKELRKKLLHYIDKNGYKAGAVFRTANGNPVDRSNFWSEMKKLSKKAGVNASKIFPHNLRHLFAQSFYETYKDTVSLANILGHSSLETTRIYIMTSAKEHLKQIESLHLIM